MKILVGIAFLLIFFSLGSALIYMMKDKGRSNRTVKALAFRVGFSVCLFLLILIANHYGLVQPTGIR
ncbi:twin transmembrane helix small protein [Undibacterium sp. LX40W]|uniref:Twin transmembrane helix small protein n=1 Tax=Undibacterium nitidum TaxID=2762298 RepID=A0A923HNP3_9BURK|nr:MULTISPECIES: twin transmembrane helix small protein [Undibacterium]MBC3882402.1 twin transmembrane helix small protein [Undibacterium nitidum]MBC3892683.1 twin transmembrane helix small protein [Undibacterium sp. LX40W]